MQRKLMMIFISIASLLLLNFHVHGQTRSEFVLLFSRYIDVSYIDGVSGEQQIGNAIRLFMSDSRDREPRLLRDIDAPYFSEIYPTWSNDGTSVLYGFSYQLGSFLHILDIETDELVSIPAPIPLQTLAWSLSNRYVALSNGTGDSDQTVFGDWAVIDVDNEEILRLEHGQVAQWSPIQDILLINQLSISQDNPHALISYDVTEDTQTTILESDYPFISPTWSADGRFIYYSASMDNNADIYRLDVSNDDILQLTDSTANENHPLPSPNGDSVAYIIQSVTGLVNGLNLIAVDGSNTRQILPFGAYFNFQWLPDNSGFVFYTMIESNDFEATLYSLAWLDLTCIETEVGCTMDDIEIIPNTETIRHYDFDIWMP